MKCSNKTGLATFHPGIKLFSKAVNIHLYSKSYLLGVCAHARARAYTHTHARARLFIYVISFLLRAKSNRLPRPKEKGKERGEGKGKREEGTERKEKPSVYINISLFHNLRNNSGF